MEGMKTAADWCGSTSNSMAFQNTFASTLLNVCRYRFVSLSGDLYENHIFIYIRFCFILFSFLIESIHYLDESHLRTNHPKKKTEQKKNTFEHAFAHAIMNWLKKRFSFGLFWTRFFYCIYPIINFSICHYGCQQATFLMTLMHQLPFQMWFLKATNVDDRFINFIFLILEWI